MRKAVAIVALGLLLLGICAPPADAHGGSSAALALAAFFAFNALLLPFTVAASVFPPVVYPPPYPYAASAPVAASMPAAPAPVAPNVVRVVTYEHGRYVLYGDGVSTAYEWVWVPNPPPPGSAPGY